MLARRKDLAITLSIRRLYRRVLLETVAGSLRAIVTPREVVAGGGEQGLVASLWVALQVEPIL